MTVLHLDSATIFKKGSLHKFMKRAFFKYLQKRYYSFLQASFDNFIKRGFLIKLSKAQSGDSQAFDKIIGMVI